MNKSICLYNIATNAYRVFIPKYIETLSKVWPQQKKKLVLITDSDDDKSFEQMVFSNLQIVHKKIDHFDWPLITWYKMNFMRQFIDEANGYDFIGYFNSNVTFRENSVFPGETDKVVLTYHIFDTTNNLANGRAPTMRFRNSVYVQGCAFIVSSHIAMRFLDDICNIIKMCELRGKLLQWHDETALNIWHIHNNDQCIVKNMLADDVILHDKMSTGIWKDIKKDASPRIDCVPNVNDDYPCGIVIVGKNRTRMTIKNIESLHKHIKHNRLKYFIGSDRSDVGHVECIEQCLKSLDCKYEIICSTPTRYGLGAIMNMALQRAFRFSPIALCIENDMIIHNDLDIHDYIGVLLHSNIGNIGFRYYIQSAYKCHLNEFTVNDRHYIVPSPLNEEDIGYPVDFGENLFSKKFIESIGPFEENNNDAAAVERQFVQAYVKQLKNEHCQLKAYDQKYFHTMMNDNAGVFYHVGIFSQHNPNARWNMNLIPKEYHDLSNDDLDNKFRAKITPFKV